MPLSLSNRTSSIRRLVNQVYDDLSASGVLGFKKDSAFNAGPGAGWKVLSIDLSWRGMICRFDSDAIYGLTMVGQNFAGPQKKCSLISSLLLFKIVIVVLQAVSFNPI